MRTQRKGYSLFETLVVLGVVVIALAIAVPVIRSMFADAPVKAGVDLVKARWAEARARAMEDGKPYRFAVVGTEGKFRVAADDAFDASSDGEDSLPKDVTFGTPQNDASGEAGSVVFYADGTASGDLELSLCTQGCAPITLKLNKTTCASSVSR